MRLSCLAVLILLPAFATAKPVRKPTAYVLDGVDYEGVAIFDDAVKTPRPGLVLVPNWLGITDDNLAQAQELAGTEYVVFVADLYGKAGRPKSVEEAGKAAGALKGNRRELRARMAGALSQLVLNAAAMHVDLARTAAIGFCLGGTAVLELARAGANVKTVVSFHGGLDAALPSEKRPTARILALHGADDPTVTPADLQAFQDDLKRVKADWTLVEFGGAVHSFTDPKASTPGRAMYDAKVSKRAFELMRSFLAESFEG